MTVFFYTFAIVMFSLMFLRIFLPDFIRYVETANPVLLSLVIVVVVLGDSKFIQKKIGVGASRVKKLPLWLLAVVFVACFSLMGCFWFSR